MRDDGQYHEVPRSVAFPFLSAIEILDWVNRPSEDSETAWIKALRRWVVDRVDIPRANPEGGA
jgi:hypothetical protein